MRLAVFDTRRYDRTAFEQARAGAPHDISYFVSRLTPETCALASGFEAVCAFVNDVLDDAMLTSLHASGVRLVALRSAGFNHVDLEAAGRLGIKVTRVPDYSPHAVAEHAVALVLSLNRKIHRAHARVRESNFSLEGLVGFDLFGKTVGLLGTGRIGVAAARIFRGFGCKVLAWDAAPSAALEAEGLLRYVPLDTLLASSDIVSLHIPLGPTTQHLLDAGALARMKRGAMLINTSRGGLIDSVALLAALKSGQVGSAGLDVYEAEGGIFFSDLSGEVLQDDVLARLLSMPSVLVTSHQAFLTHEALGNIATSTLACITSFERGEPLRNEVSALAPVPGPARV